MVEIPKPRWTTYDAKRLGVKPLEDTALTTQERAYTSPIWYSYSPDAGLTGTTLGPEDAFRFARGEEATSTRRPAGQVGPSARLPRRRRPCGVLWLGEFADFETWDRSNITARVAVETGTTMGWHKYVTDGGAVIGLDHFGASAPAGKLFTEFGFSAEHIAATVRDIVGGRV